MTTPAATIDQVRTFPAASDLIELARPRLVTLGVAVVALSYLIAPGVPSTGQLALVTLGSALALCGASTLNQLLERDTDGLMRRTASRPLPAGRVHPASALAWGQVTTLVGVTILALSAGVLTALLTLAGWALYLAVYTPMKRRSSAAVYAGAVPGAVPVLIGWSAMTGSLDAAAASLFAILCVWQMPHFLAIGWMYRADYRRAGLRVVPASDEAGASVARQAVFFAAMLAALCLLPLALGITTAWWYAFGAVVAALYQLVAALRFRREQTGLSARGLLKASVVMLPVVLALLAAGAAIAPG